MPKVKGSTKTFGQGRATPAPAAKTTKVDSSRFIVDPDEVESFFAKDKKRRDAERSAFKPTVWLREGTERLFSVRHNGPIWFGYVHEDFIKSKNKPLYHTCHSGDNDCLMCDAGWPVRGYAIFEMVDLTGYTPKRGPNAGKLVANVPMFYMANDPRREELLELLKLDLPDGVDSADCVIRIKRVANNHNFRYLPSETVPPAAKKAEDLFAKFDDFWGELSEEEQRTETQAWLQRQASSFDVES